MRKSRLVYLKCLSVSILFAVSTAYGIESRDLKIRRGRMIAGGTARMFSTTKNYDSSGLGEPLTGSKKLDLSTLTGFYRYDMTGRLAMALEGDSSWITVNDGSNNKTNAGLTEIRLLPRFLVYNRLFDFHLEGAVTLPLYRVTRDADLPMPGEGAAAFGGNAIVSKTFGGFGITGRLGYLWRDEERSALRPWSLGADWMLSKDFGIGVRAYGYSSVSQDMQPGTRRTLIDRVNAGSYTFYSPEPNLTSFDVTAEFRFHKEWSIRGGGGSTVSGIRAAAGNFYFASVVWDTAADSERAKRPSRTDGSSEGFVIDKSQDTDETLFEDDPFIEE